MAHISTSTPVTSGVFARVRQSLGHVLSMLQREREIRRTCTRLHTLTDRELEDIGLQRFGLSEAVRDRYYPY